MEEFYFWATESNTPAWVLFIFQKLHRYFLFIYFHKYLFTPCKAKQPLLGMKLQEKKHKKDCRMQKISLERTYK